MLTLIKREIEDNIVFFVTAAILTTMIISVLVYKMPLMHRNDQIVGVPSVMYRVFKFFPFNLSPLIAAVLGALQMFKDRDKKISAFLSTLATTRRQILTARIITGVLWILLLILPIAAAEAILLKVFPMAAVPDVGFLRNIFITLFLCCLAGYAFGLQIGWHGKKLVSALSVIFITPILMSLIVIKGFGFETMAILVLFTAVMMIRT